MNREEEQQMTDSLSSEFQKVLDLNDELNNSSMPTNDHKFQEKVSEGIKKLEQLTNSVNQLGVFSANESVEEVSTENLKYLLLPALLADLTLRNQRHSRVEVLDTAEIYYKDYVNRLNDYQVCDVALGDDKKEESDEKKSKLKKDPLIKSAQFRDMKIHRYREMKELEDELTKMKRLIFEQENKGLTVDDDVERKFYIKLIHRWLNKALDELASIEMEKPMAKMRVSMLMNSSSGTNRNGASTQKSKPLRPIIITRNQVEKKVYGLGYPSIPTVTVDEFVNKKLEEGTLAFTDKNIYSNSLYDWASDPEKKKQNDLNEEEQKELLVENDNEEELLRKRRMDDWKDEHRRGEGNRHNMG